MLRDGRELRRDRWDNYLLTDADGVEHRVQIAFDYKQLGPVIEVAGQRHLVFPPLPVWIRVCLAALFVLGPLGGAIGALLASGAVFGTLSLLRRPDRRPVHTLAAILLPFAAVATGVAGALLLRALR